MKSRISRRCGERAAEHTLAISLPPKTSIEIGQVDGSGRILSAEPNGRSVLDFRFGPKPAPRIEAAKRTARFRAVGVELLSRDKFGSRTIETIAVGRWLARCWNRSEQRGGSDAYPSIGIRKER